MRRPRRGPAGQSVRATDDGPEWDMDADVSMLDDSMTGWQREKQVADDRIQQHSALDSVGAGNGYSLRWNLQKLIGEYARRNGHAESARCRMQTTAARGKAIGQGVGMRHCSDVVVARLRASAGLRGAAAVRCSAP